MDDYILKVYERSVKENDEVKMSRSRGEEYIYFKEIESVIIEEGEYKVDVSLHFFSIGFYTLEFLCRDLNDIKGKPFICFMKSFRYKEYVDLSMLDEETIKKIHLSNMKLVIDFMNEGFKLNKKNGEMFIDSKSTERWFKTNLYLDEASRLFSPSIFKLTDDRCVVCYDSTDHTTRCGHKLCIPCIIKMKNLTRDKCPICRRGNILIYNRFNILEIDE